MKKGGCWIFLSHSSHDIEKVRMIRNEFEKYSHNPLAFHLRCLNADTPEGKFELDTLIKREIDCREWFVFCESPEASKSSYVEMEKDYILKQGKQNVWSIDMSLSEAELLQKVKEICGLIKVYICYTLSDGTALYESLAAALKQKDFDVRCCENLIVGTDWQEEIDAMIEDTVESGFSIVLITENFHTSKFGLSELKKMLSCKTKVIPLVFGNAKIPPILSPSQCFYIPNIPSQEDIGLIVELIEAELRSRIVGPIRYQADKFNKIKEINEKLNYQKRYHAQEAVCVHSAGATEDYIEIYEFPCCGERVVVGDGPVSRFRADGCCCAMD